MVKIPDRGYCLSVQGAGSYIDAFEGAKRRVYAAAHVEADARRERIHVVQVQDRGNDRFIVGEVKPASWKE